MPDSMERSALHVEGNDDFHSIVHLLIRHGIDYDAKPWPPVFPKLFEAGGFKEVLLGMEEAVRLATSRAVGFVLDADSPLTERWQAVRYRLSKVEVATPEEPPSDGFVGHSATYNATAGVWLMPDNRHDGTLETFLQTLVEESDVLIEHARRSTDGAMEHGARFSRADRQKAVLHTWLAWQEEPGRPYGTAIRAQYFRHDSDVATAFVAWFKRLYGME